MVGASGAVMAVVTLYTLFYPRREILFFFLPMPMWALLGIYLVFPLFNGQNQQSRLRGPSDGRGLRASATSSSTCGGRGWSTAGFAVRGCASSPPCPSINRGPGPQLEPVTAARRPGLQAVVGLGPARRAARRPLDEVLAKIAREGRRGLTEEDHRVLQEASRRARDKRSDRP